MVTVSPSQPRRKLLSRLSPFGGGDDDVADRARLEAFLDAVPGEYCGFAQDGTVVFSDGLALLLGISPPRTLPDLQTALTPGDAAALEGLFQTLRDQGHAFSISARSQDGAKVFRIAGRCGRDRQDLARVNILWFEDATPIQAEVERVEAAHDAASHERDRLQAAFDLAPLASWMRDADGSLTWCNRAYARIFDTTPATVIAEQKELQAKPVKRDPVPPRPAGKALAKEAQRSRHPESVFAHVIVEGKRRLMLVTERALPEPGMTLGNALDVTREESLQHEYRRYMSANNDLLEQLGTAIGIFDAEQRLEFFNAAFAQLWDLDDTYLNARPKLGDLMEKLRETRRLPEQADFRRFKQGWLAMFTGLIAPHDEMLYLPDSTALRMLVMPHPMGGIMMTFEDVSSRLALESSYNTLVAVQKETLDNLSEGIAVIGGDGRIRLWNPAFLKLWSLVSDIFDGSPHFSKLVDRFRDCFTEPQWPAARSLLLTQGFDRKAAWGRLELRDHRIIYWSTVPLPDGGVLLTHADITDTARSEIVLREKNAALEATERLKLDFLANVSYQLRTPLSAMVGFADILANEYFGPLNDRQKEYTAGMRDAGERLVALVNDILDLSTIEAGYMTLEKSRVAIHPLLASLQALTTDWARNRAVELRLDCADDIGAIEADERRLKQVLLNLIRNAISFTPEGGQITLRARRVDAALELAVIDTGKGIAPEDQIRIFEPFERASSQDQPHSKRGAGLGLTLVRNIVAIHGGSITLHSEPDQGATFTIRLPDRS